MVLPLLALTWMSAVLAMTDRRSVLFQALFAVFNSAQGFVITAVHCFLRREVGLGLSCPCVPTSQGQSSHVSSLCRPGELRPQPGFQLGNPGLPGLLGLLLPSALPLG